LLGHLRSAPALPYNLTMHTYTVSLQAKTPGEKNMSVAVLFMIFGIPMLPSAAAGLLCLLVGALAFAHGRFFQRISN